MSQRAAAGRHRDEEQERDETTAHQPSRACGGYCDLTPARKQNALHPVEPVCSVLPYALSVMADTHVHESPAIEEIRGYFTLERNIEGLNLLEMESALGYPRGQLLEGARVLLLAEQPSVGQFVFAGSTLTPNADDLVPVARRANIPVPGAWLGQRLVKVKPILSPIRGLSWPRAKRPVEQWQLCVPVAATEVRRLGVRDVYWRRR